MPRKAEFGSIFPPPAGDAKGLVRMANPVIFDQLEFCKWLIYEAFFEVP